MVSSHLRFLFDFLIIYKSDLLIKIILISKFMTSQTGYQTIPIHILTNISRSKGNEVMKFSQLIEYNMRTIFIEKSLLNSGGETIPDLFLKNQSWANLWINNLKFHTICFYCMASGGLSNYIKKKLQTSCFYLTQSFFKKQK